jgi:hypothetical protein
VQFTLTLAPLVPVSEHASSGPTPHIVLHVSGGSPAPGAALSGTHSLGTVTVTGMQLTKALA